MLEAKWDTFCLIFTSICEHTPDLFHQTKHLTNLVSSDEVMGFHITAPFAGPPLGPSSSSGYTVLALEIFSLLEYHD